MTASPTDIDGYLAAIPDDQRAALQHLRATIRSVAPDAVESISYGVPTFKYRGRPLAYFGAAKKHCALYGFSIEGYEAELAAYDTAKGTIRFQPTHPLPDDLVTRLVSARKASIEAAATKGKKQGS